MDVTEDDGHSTSNGTTSNDVVQEVRTQELTVQPPPPWNSSTSSGNEPLTSPLGAAPSIPKTSSITSPSSKYVFGMAPSSTAFLSAMSTGAKQRSSRPTQPTPSPSRYVTPTSSAAAAAAMRFLTGRVDKAESNEADSADTIPGGTQTNGEQPDASIVNGPSVKVKRRRRRRAKSAASDSKRTPFGRGFVAIDCPGYFGSTSAFYTALGGEEAVMSSIAKATTSISYRLHSDAEPILGDRRSSNSLLLKVRRRKVRRPNGSKTDTATCEILGEVRNVYKFDTLADFSFEEGKPQKLNIPTFDDLLGSEYFSSEQQLRLVPKHFCKDAKPQDYSFKNNAPQAQYARYGLIVQAFNDHVPTEAPDLPPEPQLEPEEMKARQICSTALQECFKNRPVWTKNALMQYSPSIAWTTMRNLMPHIAFKYRNGPFRQCFVRYGYDPRQEPSSFYYQILDLRITVVDGNRSKSSERAPSESHKPSKWTGQKLEKNMVFQLCDIHESRLQGIINSVPCREECDEQDGWLQPSVLVALRAEMKRQNQESTKSQVVSNSTERPSECYNGDGDSEDEWLDNIFG